MARQNARQNTLRHMRRSTEALSEMLAHTVAQARALQKQQEAALGPAASREELAAQCDTRTMKELTAILKDIATVARALEEGEPGTAGPAGVVLLPPVDLPEEAAPPGESAAEEAAP